MVRRWALVNTVMNLRGFLTGSVTTRVLRRNLLYGAICIKVEGNAFPVIGRGGP
jgi:hypothetical protein